MAAIRNTIKAVGQLLRTIYSLFSSRLLTLQQLIVEGAQVETDEMHMTSQQLGTGKNPSVSTTREDRNKTTNPTKSEDKMAQHATSPPALQPSPVKASPAMISAERARHRSRRPSKTVPMIPFGTLIQGKYELQKVLGAGGYGQIFKAFDSVSDKR
ncbi:unnamed protein product [Haemonchus placei]|uniref:Protein kinase domain-containing protein n=1 Tax=Haemonchus placei TaxID=6290 RepID=A0A0N4WLN0_HAEPC|nr:unnamed protein product [Haemonchus placei]